MPFSVREQELEDDQLFTEVCPTGLSFLGLLSVGTRDQTAHPCFLQRKILLA